MTSLNNSVLKNRQSFKRNIKILVSRLRGICGVFVISIRRITEYAQATKDWGELAKCSSNIDIGRLDSGGLSGITLW